MKTKLKVHEENIVIEDFKKFVKKFNLCSHCGCGNFAFEVYKNNDPKYGGYWCVSCLECGCNMTGCSKEELLKNWNADLFKEPEKKEIKVVNISKDLPINYYDKYRTEREPATSVHTDIQKFDLTELADKIEESRYRRVLRKMDIEQNERDRSRAKELSLKKHINGYLSKIEEEELDSAIFHGLL